MEKIITTLDLRRTSFTKIFDKTIELLAKENPDMNQVRSNIQVLEQKMRNVSQLDQRYLDLLLDQDPTDVHLDSEMTKIDEYMCNFSALKRKVNNKNTPSTSSCCTQSCSKLQLKYPQIEFRKFGGDIRDWLSTHAFQKIC